MSEVRAYYMMLQHVLARSLTKPSEATAAGNEIKRVEREGPTLKGLFFVHLYGAYEFTVHKVVEETIQFLNTQMLIVADCRPILLSLILDPHCKSLRDVGREKEWIKRCEMFQMVNSQSTVSIDTSIMPTSGRNLSSTELVNIWTTFGLGGSPLPSPRSQVRVNELVEKRNAIAHGRNTSAEVGSRYTLHEIGEMLQSIDEVCVHLIQSFQSYLVNREYRA